MEYPISDKIDSNIIERLMRQNQEFKGEIARLKTEKAQAEKAEAKYKNLKTDYNKVIKELEKLKRESK